jgi:hypothetical protein
VPILAAFVLGNGRILSAHGRAPRVDLRRGRDRKQFKGQAASIVEEMEPAIQ